MDISLLVNELSQAKAILRDAHLRATTDRKDKQTMALLKLCKAREENIDFELGLAERICGDTSRYPYRSSYFLTKFFVDLGFDRTHDGTTRRFWVRDVLVELDAYEISRVIQKGLFARRAFKNQAFRIEETKDLPDDEFLNNAILEFKTFIDESTRANEAVDLDRILDLNVNIEMLFDRRPRTKDEELNKLIDEAKDRFLKPGDQNVALEKLWDAFERLKTYHDHDKKRSADKLVGEMAIDLKRDIFADEFKILTNIGNNYRIRHHESDKIPISSPSQINYLFFRMLSLIDLALEVLKDLGSE